MGTVIMETAHTGKCATPLASEKSVYAYAGPTGVFRCRAPYEQRTARRTWTVVTRPARGGMERTTMSM